MSQPVDFRTAQAYNNTNLMWGVCGWHVCALLCLKMSQSSNDVVDVGKSCEVIYPTLHFQTAMRMQRSKRNARRDTWPSDRCGDRRAVGEGGLRALWKNTRSISDPLVMDLLTHEHCSSVS